MSWKIFVSCRPVAANGFEKLRPLINYRFSAVPVKDGGNSKSPGCRRDDWESQVPKLRGLDALYKGFSTLQIRSWLPHLEINVFVLKE